jgi:NAD+ kinase
MFGGFSIDMAPSSQASFRLAWGCTGKKASRRHKHDFVSFECGNITTASRSSKQV